MERNQEMKLNILQAMHMLPTAWNAVRTKRIVYYLKKAGFSCNDSAALDVDLSHVWRRPIMNLKGKYKNSVCTTGCSQDIEEMYDVKEKEREGNKSKKSLFPLLGEQLRYLK